MGGAEPAIMGSILLATSLELFAIAAVLAPIIRRIGVDALGRRSLTAVLVCLAAYLSWISVLFFQDRLGPNNYALALWAVRLALLAACSLFLWSAWRCRRKLMRSRGWSDAGR